MFSTNIIGALHLATFVISRYLKQKEAVSKVPKQPLLFAQRGRAKSQMFDSPEENFPYETVTLKLKNIWPLGSNK
jgi:hypothetical protein